jgi:hypothetical protein
MRLERQTLLLVGLALVVAVAAWRLLSGEATPGAAPGPRNAAANAAQAQGDPQAPLDVRIEALSAERPEPEKTGRNPFQFRAKPAPPPPATATNALSGMVSPMLPAGPPPAPPITLKYIGLVQKAGGIKVAVLSDGRSQPVYGQQGDILLGSYRIVSIGVESIELEHQDGRGRQTIRLTGQ